MKKLNWPGPTINGNGWYFVKARGDFGWIHGSTVRIINTGTKTRKVSKRENKWMYASSSTSRVYYINWARLAKRGSLVKLWVLTRRNDDFSRASLVRYEIRCRQMEERTLQLVDYDREGKVTRSWTNKKPPFEGIVPDSVFEGVAEKVCKKR